MLYVLHNMPKYTQDENNAFLPAWVEEKEAFDNSAQVFFFLYPMSTILNVYNVRAWLLRYAEG